MGRYERVSSAARILECCLISLFVLSTFGSNGMAEEQSGHSGTVDSVAFSPDGAKVLTGSSDKTAKVWETGTGKLLRTFKHPAGVNAVAFSPDGTRVLTGRGGFDETANLWETDTGRLLRTFAHTEVVKSVAFSPDGTRVLTGGFFDKTAKLWETESGKLLRTFTGPKGMGGTAPPGIGHEQSVNSVAFSSDGARVLTGSTDRTAKLWEMDTGKLLRTFIDETLRDAGVQRSHFQSVWSVAISSNGALVLTGSHDAKAKLWETDTGKLLRTFEGSGGAGVVSVAFSPDGAQMLTGGNDNTAKLWETDTGNLVRTFTGHSSGVNSVAFSSDGARVLTGSTDRTAKLWETDTGKLLRTFK